MTNTLRCNGGRRDHDAGPIEAVALAGAGQEKNQADVGIPDDRRRAGTQRAYMPIQKHPAPDTTIPWHAQTLCAPPPSLYSAIRRTRVGIIEHVPVELAQPGRSGHDNNRRRSRKPPQQVCDSIPARGICETPAMRAAPSSRRKVPDRTPRRNDRGGSVDAGEDCPVGERVLESAPHVSRTTPTALRLQSQSVARSVYATTRHKP